MSESLEASRLKDADIIHVQTMLDERDTTLQRQAELITAHDINTLELTNRVEVAQVSCTYRNCG